MISEWSNHLWQSTVFAAAAGLLTIAFRENRAQVRFWLWLSASFKFLLPFSLLMNLGGRLEWTPAAQKIAPPAVSSTIVQVSQPFSAALTEMQPLQSGYDLASIAILSLWACGFSGVMLIRLRGWLRVRAAIRASYRIEMLANVEVRSSPGLLEPGVVGLFRSILLLPAAWHRRLEIQLENVENALGVHLRTYSFDGSIPRTWQSCLFSAIEKASASAGTHIQNRSRLGDAGELDKKRRQQLTPSPHEPFVCFGVGEHRRFR